MSVLPLFLGCVVLAAEPTGPMPAGYLPAGAAAELYDLGQLARLRDPQVQSLAIGASPSMFRADLNQTVLANVDGPGILQRIWFDAPPARPLRRPVADRRHFRIYLDRHAGPVLDVTLTELYSGQHPRFPRPIVGAGPGGAYCDIPIPFREHCLVTLEGREDNAFQLEFSRLPTSQGITTFDPIPSPEVRDDLRLAKALWMDPDALFSKAAEVRKMVILNPAVAEYPVDAERRATQVFELPAGPRTIRSFEILATPQTAEAWRSARLRLIWDGDSVAQAGVDAPAGFFYVQTERAMMPHASLIVSHREQRWSSRFPMPYQRGAKLQIDSDEPISGKIRVRTLPGVDPSAGYFRARFHTLRGAVPERGYELVAEQGRGHFVGLFVLAEGSRANASPLDGSSLNFTLDGASSARRERLLAYFNGTKDRPEYAEVGPASGFPIVLKDDGAKRVGAYRWHVTDPIVFARSLTAKLGPDDVATAAPDMRAVVFWYSEHPGPTRSGP